MSPERYRASITGLTAEQTTVQLHFIPLRRSIRVAGPFAAAVAAMLWGVAVMLAALDGDLRAVLPGVASVAFAVVGAIVVWQKPWHRVGWVLCAIGLCLALAGAATEWARRSLVGAPGSLPAGLPAAWLADFMTAPTIALLCIVLPLLFPTGALLSPRWRPALWGAAAFVLGKGLGNGFTAQPLTSVPSRTNPYVLGPARVVWSTTIVVGSLLGLISMITAVAALAVRWRRSRGDERQQLKWFLGSFAMLPVLVVAHSISPTASDAAIASVLVLMPVTMGIAVLKHRLYDLDLAVNRAVAFSTLSTLVAGVYLSVVALGEAATGDVTLAGHVVAALVAATSLQPLRTRVQRAVDRLFYGDRSRPYDALTRLSRRLELAVDPDTVLPGVVGAVKEALNVLYVAIDIRDDDDWLVAAEGGRPTAEESTFPMTFQAKLVGRLRVGARGDHEHLNEADRRLLTDLARHAGAAVLAVQTTTALQRSRVKLVTAREEERRRIRRDLHDGLGPTLSGVSLGLHAARAHLHDDVGTTEGLLAESEARVEEAVSDIRRLVYGLRPPALDEFGLVRAVSLHAALLEGSGGVSIAVEEPADGLGVLPAAVEVAAYRIATEALTNVTRHAGAHHARVSFRRTEALEVEIVDDGSGLGADVRYGVGLNAMRERATELGGTLTVESDSAGTRIVAHLPAPTRSMVAT